MMDRTHPVLLMLAQSALSWVGAPKTIRQPLYPSHYYKESYFFKKLSFLTTGSIRLRKYNSQDQEIGFTRPLPIIAQRLGLGLGSPLGERRLFHKPTQKYAGSSRDPAFGNCRPCWSGFFDDPAAFESFRLLWVAVHPYSWNSLAH